MVPSGPLASSAEWNLPESHLRNIAGIVAAPVAVAPDMIQPSEVSEFTVFPLDSGFRRNDENLRSNPVAELPTLQHKGRNTREPAILLALARSLQLSQLNPGIRTENRGRRGFTQ